MPESFYDTVVILFYTVIPLVLILLQVLFSRRKRPAWGFIVPALWTALGIWILVSGQKNDSQYSLELCIFFLGGDAILLCVMALTRYLKGKKGKQGKRTGNKNK